MQLCKIKSALSFANEGDYWDDSLKSLSGYSSKKRSQYNSSILREIVVTFCCEKRSSSESFSTLSICVTRERKFSSRKDISNISKENALSFSAVLIAQTFQAAKSLQTIKDLVTDITGYSHIEIDPSTPEIVFDSKVIATPHCLMIFQTVL